MSTATEPPDLTREDWQYISYRMQIAFNEARPKPSEGKPSPEFIAQEKRIFNYLNRKAFG
jgi:hypothetical protein